MASSQATTVAAYLDELPAERRAIIEQVRTVILQNLPAGYEEQMRYGMISYEVPLARYPKTYNKQPLSYIGLAAQKNAYSLYLMCQYNEAMPQEWLAERFAEAGKKLNMGKSCVRFRRLEDLPLDVIGEAVAMINPEQFIAQYEQSRLTSR
ncbi:MAG: DUF1801 domain-containing protein [Caldilineales bacterium]